MAPLQYPLPAGKPPAKKRRTKIQAQVVKSAKRWYNQTEEPMGKFTLFSPSGHAFVGTQAV